VADADTNLMYYAPRGNFSHLRDCNHNH